MKRLTIIIVFILLHSSMAAAGFIGPTTIIEKQWGKGDTAFGFNAGEIKDQFPEKFIVLTNGSIIIEDWVNDRLKIYNGDGTYSKSIKQPGLGFCELDSDRIIMFSWDKVVKGQSIGVFNLSQEKYIWIDRSRIFDSDSASVNFANNNIFVWDGKNGYQYTPTGQLIKTSATEPPELGIVQSQKIADKQYKVTVTYPDRSWSTIEGSESFNYQRDINGNFYGLNDNTAARFNSCGKELGRVVFPKLKYKPRSARKISGTPPADAEVPLPAVAEEYGKPVLAPNGDVYTWKRTPDKYSIVKWTWQDDANTPTGPDAPAGLAVAASTTGLYLTWTASPQDPGCVSGYEISRSATSGGTFSVVATVDKSILNYNDTTAVVGTTYYYKLRAKAGNDFSAYTAEASGMR